MTQTTSTRNFVGVLELNCGKTYGRQVRTTGKEGRLLYGIRHSYPDLPALKAPYDVRSQQGVGTCSRYVKDKYVVFSVDGDVLTSKDELTQRPEAVILETLGDVDDGDAFGTYKTYLAGMRPSSGWVKPLAQVRGNAAEKAVVRKAYETVPTLRHPSVMTIDPEGCADMDDAIGAAAVDECDAAGFGRVLLTIAITHVPSFLLAAGLTSSQLIEAMANTCSLYLPGRVVNMMPKRFAENVCSLVAGTTRPALCLCVLWNRRDGKAENVRLTVENVKVTKNYVYDSSELNRDKSYMLVRDCVMEMSVKWRAFKTCPFIRDSHDVVAYAMTLMNHYTAEWMGENGLGGECVYRMNRARADMEFPVEFEHLRSKIGNYSGEYVTADEVADMRGADGVTVWCHITSPMRRLADLVNMLTVSRSILDRPAAYDTLEPFRQHCIGIVSRMSAEYKAGRRVSLDCEMFAFVKSLGDSLKSGEGTNDVFNGVVVQMDTEADRVVRVVVYVEELSRFFNCETRMASLALFQEVECRIVAFEEGHSIHDKVRVMLVEN